MDNSPENSKEKVGLLWPNINTEKGLQRCLSQGVFVAYFSGAMSIIFGSLMALTIENDNDLIYSIIYSVFIGILLFLSGYLLKIKGSFISAIFIFIAVSGNVMLKITEGGGAGAYISIIFILFALNGIRAARRKTYQISENKRKYN